MRVLALLLSCCFLAACSSDPGSAPTAIDEDTGSIDEDTGEIDSGEPEDTAPVDSGTDACASCALPNASSRCVAGKCAIVACNPGYDDCDRKAATGCEISLATTSHCGACGNACTAGPNAIASCVANKCETTCKTGFVACASGCCLPPSDVTKMDAGDRFNCAITETGALKCWGASGYGQTGTGSTAATVLTPTVVTGLESGVATVSAGRLHACAVTGAGAAKCWGYNGSQQLGATTPSSTGSATPIEVTGLSSGVSAIAAGHVFTCALLSTGSVKCWGSAAIGDGVSTKSAAPIAVSSITDAKAIAAGYSHACVLTAGGAVKCWGSNSSGQVGVATPTDVKAPVTAIASGAIAIATGQSHTCAVLATGALQCWGSRFTSTPADVPGATDARSVSADYTHTCYVTTGGAAKCFGGNSYGQLGDGTKTTPTTPVVVSGLSSGVASIHAGDWHTCARLTTGKIKCWGKGDEGQLGDGVMPASGKTTPVDVIGF